MLESDGVHLTALSGFHFVHHLFNSALCAIKSLTLPTEQKVLDAQLTGTVVSSRLSALEQQFVAFKSRSDLEFAIQQESNDWNENLATERFFVLTGLPAAPQKLSGGFLFACLHTCYLALELRLYNHLIRFS